MTSEKQIFSVLVEADKLGLLDSQTPSIAYSTILNNAIKILLFVEEKKSLVIDELCFEFNLSLDTISAYMRSLQRLKKVGYVWTSHRHRRKLYYIPATAEELQMIEDFIGG